MVHVDSYLFLSRHNIYYFRAIVPKDVGTGLHKREYLRSMQTRNLLVARGMARVLRVCFEAYIEGMRDDMAEWEQLRKLLDDTMADLLASEREKLRRTGPYPAVADEIWKNDVIPNYTKAIADISALRSKQQGGAANDIPPFAKDLAKRDAPQLQQQLPLLGQINQTLCGLAASWVEGFAGQLDQQGGRNSGSLGERPKTRLSFGLIALSNSAIYRPEVRVGKCPWLQQVKNVPD